MEICIIYIVAILLYGSLFVLCLYRPKFVFLEKIFRKIYILHIFNVLISIFSLIRTITHMNDYKEPFFETYFYVAFYIDALSLWFNFIVAAVTVMVSFHSWAYIDFKNNQEDIKEKRLFNASKYYFLLNTFVLSMFLVQMINDLIILCVMLEITTLVSAFLVCFDLNSKSVEASWKYITLCSLAMIFTLIGTLFITLAFKDPSKVTLSIQELIDPNQSLFDNNKIIYLKMAFFFVLVGLITKSGLAPLHSWLPDSHAEAPSPISALLSGVLLKTSFFALLRYYQVIVPFFTSSDDKIFINNILMTIGLISLIIAVPFIMNEKQEDFKRILAYHSLNHMGIIVFATGLGTRMALYAALLHAFYHALTKALMFIAHGAIRLNILSLTKDQPENFPERKYSLLSINKFYGLMIALGGLALVGSPPFAIFTTEYKILMIAITESSEWTMIFATVLFLLSLILIFGGLTNHIGRWIIDGNVFKINDDRNSSNDTKHHMNNSILDYFPIIFLFLFICIFGFGIFEIFETIIYNATSTLYKV